ncbi:hypothetical protein KPH14_001667 [Odynerus spinipes]|uniref:Leucine-rich repeat-containing protein 51 n=1 Tax=Odynerus spinipes TaxID=1348599 RepID=A0AAD9RZH0_9HYME|nr:hypothetical protein KPH14_001667 [Odynerus spinipes]
MLVGPPLDFSFKKATNIKDLANQRPQTIRTVKAPTRTSKDRFATSTIWLSNNLLKSMEGLENLVRAVLEDPTSLSWLDLSFNDINEIGDDIAKFPNLKILYLHGNNISNINDILKLRKLCNMRALTLHGNPVETLSYYRGYIINVMPQLVNLDFSRITKSEKRQALPTGFFKVIEPALQTYNLLKKMSSEMKVLEKPQLRNLLLSHVKFHFFGMIAFAGGCTLLYKFLGADVRKRKYEAFYKTYDPDASFKKMCESGYMDSCGTPRARS